MPITPRPIGVCQHNGGQRIDIVSAAVRGLGEKRRSMRCRSRSGVQVFGEFFARSTESVVTARDQRRSPTARGIESRRQVKRDVEAVAAIVQPGYFE